jgi:uncharacterized membrane-anchored protein
MMSCAAVLAAQIKQLTQVNQQFVFALKGRFSLFGKEEHQAQYAYRNQHRNKDKHNQLLVSVYTPKELAALMPSFLSL